MSVSTLRAGALAGVSRRTFATAGLASSLLGACGQESARNQSPEIGKPPVGGIPPPPEPGSLPAELRLEILPLLVQGVGILLRSPALVRVGQGLEIASVIGNVMETGTNILQDGNSQHPAQPSSGGKPAPNATDVILPVGARAFLRGSEAIAKLTVQTEPGRPTEFHNPVVAIRDKFSRREERRWDMNEMYAANGLGGEEDMCVPVGRLDSAGLKSIEVDWLPGIYAPPVDFLVVSPEEMSKLHSVAECVALEAFTGECEESRWERR